MTLRSCSRAPAPSASIWQLGALVRCGLLVAASVLGCISPAHADEASGTWTGEIEGRPNYYWERSTRVIMPAARVSLEAPNGVRMSAAYLVDVIGSASIASGVGKDGVFTELRHAVNTAVGKKFAVGDNEFDLSAHGTFSSEPDYKSWLYGVRGSFSWNERNSTLRLGLVRVDDSVLSNAMPTFRGELAGLTTNLGFTQLLSPVLILGACYQFVYLDGFLGNPYRNALVGPLPRAEAPPDHRVRHNAELQLSWFLPTTETTLQLYARTYLDSWEIFALTPEVRAYQSLGRHWTLRARYRFYEQTRAEFALASGQTRYPVGYTGPVTSDPKMSAFHSHQVGLRVEFRLAGLSGSFLDFAKDAVLDVNFDYQASTSSFGNNVIGSAGGRLPF